jgi:hypothetical protein
MARIDLTGGTVKVVEDGFKYDTQLQAGSSASYHAYPMAGLPGIFLIARNETTHHAAIPLGRCSGVDRAKKMVSWWVEQDHRVSAILKGKSSEEIEDMIIECARAIPKEQEKKVLFACSHCHGTDGELVKFHYTYQDDRQKLRRASNLLHMGCAASYIVACAGRAFWSNGETLQNEVEPSLENQLEASLPLTLEEIKEIADGLQAQPTLFAPCKKCGCRFTQDCAETFCPPRMALEADQRNYEAQIKHDGTLEGHIPPLGGDA